MKTELISVHKESHWMEQLEAIGKYDTYHLPAYHRLAETMNEGQALLFVFRHADRIAAFPFLVNNVSQVRGLEAFDLKDATSVYGYPGPLTNVDKSDAYSDSFRISFQHELMDVLQNINVVSLFSRQNPLLDTEWLLDGCASCHQLSDTVSIDLTKPEDAILGDMRANHRARIRKALKNGLQLRIDDHFENLSTFMEMYYQTMDRHNADEQYYYPNEYFLNLPRELGNSMQLFHADMGGEIVSSFLFFTTWDIIQYHLSGTPSRYLKYDGPRFILYMAAIWGKQHGYRHLHLGGGVGAMADSLFHFKAGFSPLRHRYAFLKLIVNEEQYHELVTRRKIIEGFSAEESVMDAFFPLYRIPALYQCTDPSASSEILI